MINIFSNSLSADKKNIKNENKDNSSFIRKHPVIFTLIVAGSIILIGGLIVGIYLSTMKNKENTEEDSLTEDIIINSIFPLPEAEELKVMEIYNNIGDKDKSTLEEFCVFLAEKTSNLKDELKVYLAYYWVTHNIVYDYEGLNSGNSIVEPARFFSSKKTICSGYSALFKRLLLAMNFPENDIEIIGGVAKGAGYSAFNGINNIPSHAWNAVKLNDNWCLIDTTWGTGANFFHYLCTPPKCFIRDHLPDDRQKEFQLIENKIDKETFNQIFNGDRGFCNYDVEIVENKAVQNICGKGKISIKYKNKNKLFLMFISNVDYEHFSALPQSKQNGFDVFFSVNQIGEYEIGVFFEDLEKEETFLITDIYIFCNEEPTEKFYYPSTLYYYNYEDIELISPLTRFLVKGQKYDFKIKITGYEHLHITMENEKISMKKIGKDTFEEKDVYIHGDQVYIRYINKTDDKSFLLFPTTGEVVSYPESRLFRTNLNVRLISPIQGNLTKGETYEFKIRCDDNNEKFRVQYWSNLIELEKNNGYFTKILTIDSQTASLKLTIQYYEEEKGYYSNMYEYNLN